MNGEYGRARALCSARSSLWKPSGRVGRRREAARAPCAVRCSVGQAEAFIAAAGGRRRLGGHPPGLGLRLCPVNAVSARLQQLRMLCADVSARTHAHTLARFTRKHVHTRTRTRTRARAHARALSHTHTQVRRPLLRQRRQSTHIHTHTQHTHTHTQGFQSPKSFPARSDRSQPLAPHLAMAERGTLLIRPGLDAAAGMHWIPVRSTSPAMDCNLVSAWQLHGLKPRQGRTESAACTIGVSRPLWHWRENPQTAPVKPHSAGRSPLPTQALRAVGSR